MHDDPQPRPRQARVGSALACRDGGTPSEGGSAPGPPGRWLAVHRPENFYILPCMACILGVVRVALKAPKGLGARGKRVWDAVCEAHELDIVQQVTLEEACRAADRLDVLDGRVREGDDGALSEARQQQNVMKQLFAALRLPDAAGVKPQQRGGARGAYAPKRSGTGAGNVVSLAERFA